MCPDGGACHATGTSSLNTTIVSRWLVVRGSDAVLMEDEESRIVLLVRVSRMIWKVLSSEQPPSTKALLQRSCLKSCFSYKVHNPIAPINAYQMA